MHGNPRWMKSPVVISTLISAKTEPIARPWKHIFSTKATTMEELRSLIHVIVRSVVAAAPRERWEACPEIWSRRPAVTSFPQASAATEDLDNITFLIMKSIILEMICIEVQNETPSHIINGWFWSNTFEQDVVAMIVSEPGVTASVVGSVRQSVINFVNNVLKKETLYRRDTNYRKGF